MNDFWEWTGERWMRHAEPESAGFSARDIAAFEEAWGRLDSAAFMIVRDGEDTIAASLESLADFAEVVVYDNPSGRFGSLGDTSAF